MARPPEAQADSALPLPQASVGSEPAPERQVVAPFAALIFAVQVVLSRLPAFAAVPRSAQAAPAGQVFALALARPPLARPEALPRR